MSLKKNFIYNSAYQILVFIIPLITAPYISRVLGPSGAGLYSYIHSIGFYFILIAMLGVNNYGNRSIARVRDNKKKLSETFWGIYYLQLFLSLLMFILFILFVFLATEQYLILFILQSFYVLSAAFDINWFYFGLEKFKMTVIRGIIIKVVTVIAIFIFVNSKDDLWIYILIMSIGSLLGQLVLWPFVTKIVGLLKPSYYEIKKHIKPNLILFIPVIAVSFYKIMDKIMLGSLSTTDQVGYFAYSENIINIPMSLITALGTVMLPRMSNLAAKNDISQSKYMIEKSMLFVMLMSIAFAFGLSGIAPVFIPWFLGNQFLESIPLTSLLSITMVFISWANVVRTQYLIPNSRDRIFIISVIAGAVTNLVINALLIPSMGAKGAVIGTIFAEFTVCFIQTWMVRKDLDFPLYFKNCFPFIFIGALMFLIVRSIAVFAFYPIITIVLQIVIGAIFYLSLSLIYLIKVRKEYEIINSIFSFLKLKRRY